MRRIWTTLAVVTSLASVGAAAFLGCAGAFAQRPTAEMRLKPAAGSVPDSTLGCCKDKTGSSGIWACRVTTLGECRSGGLQCGSGDSFCGDADWGFDPETRDAGQCAKTWCG